ncbi:MAG: MATE family efflux transporter [Clostridia bacterium]|nr:MATE family efflux transporter [Clostridia bacterium]
MSFFKRDGIDMTHGPFLKKLILFALPVLMTGFLQLLYNTADLIVVGQFASSEAQGAIQSTSSLMHLIVGVSMGLSVGVNVAVAKHIGAKDGPAASKVVHTAVLLSLFCGSVVGLIGFFQSRHFLLMMDSDPDLIGLSELYLKIYFIGTPLNLLYNFGAAALRAKGETQKPLTYLLISGAVNVVLNLMFVIGFKMDVDGVAVATVTSQALSATLVVVELARTNGYCKLDFKKLKIDPSALWEIVKIGVPAGIQSSLFSVSNVIIQSTINSFGKVIITANGNAQSIEGYMNIAVDCVYQAALSFIGQNYGANNKDNITRVMRLTFIMVTTVCVFLAALIIPLRRVFLAAYNTDHDIITRGETRILINGSTYFIFGWMQVFVAYLRGLGHGVVPVIVSIMGICVFRIVWIYTVFPYFKTLENVYLSYPISWAITALTHFSFYLMLRKSTYKKMAAEAASRSVDQGDQAAA